MKKAMTSREKYLALLRRDKLKVRGIQVALLVIFIGVWELATAAGLADSFFVSSPSRIIKTLAGMAGADLMRHVWITLYECILGFVISTAGRRNRRSRFVVERNGACGCRTVPRGA